MRNGGDDAREEGEVVADEEEEEQEWSPIREPFRGLPAPQPPVYERFDEAAAEVEDGAASSDMDTDDDGSPAFAAAAASAAFAASLAAEREDDPVRAAASDAVESRGEGSETLAGGPALKRKRLPEHGENSFVQITYKGLSRESKKILQQALQNWSTWHYRTYGSGSAGLEGGTEVYSPAFALTPTSNSCAISVWIDKPASKQEPRTAEQEDSATANCQNQEEDVPLYDRACVSMTIQDSRDRSDGYCSIEPEEDLRCFNCGSYSHSLRDCRRPHVSPAIKKARDRHLGKKRSLPRSRTLSRYYQSSPGGKFDDLKPGILGPETRKGLGIGEWDPPPWLHRMREIGYPPGYLEDEESSSGVEIFGENNEAIPGKQLDDDEIVPGKGAPALVRDLTARKTVDYPGINAPIPEKADKTSWESAPGSQHQKSSRDAMGSFQLDVQVSKRADTVLGSESLIPRSPPCSRVINANDMGSQDGTALRSASSNQWDSHAAIAPDKMNSFPGGSSPYVPGTLYPTANDNAGLSADPGRYLFPRRAHGFGASGVDAADFANARFGGRGPLHSPSRSSGLGSSLRGLLGSPGESFLGSPPRIYSRQNYYHSQAQGSLSPLLQFAKQGSNESWVKAQAALDALQPTRLPGGSLVVPLDVVMGAGSPRKSGHR